MKEPNLNKLLQEVEGRLHVLNPWDEQGQSLTAQALSFMAGIDEVKSTSPTGQFRIRDIEPLIEQASALLDRALSDRAALQQIGEKLATFTLDVRRSMSLIDISDAERENNRFETPYQVSRSMSESQHLLATTLAASIENGSARRSVQQRLDQYQSIQSWRAGWLHYLALWNPKEFGPTDQTFADGGFLYKGTRVEIGSQIAHDLSSEENEIRLLEVKTEIRSITDQADVAVKASDAKDAQMRWDDVNRGFLAARAEVERDELMLKLAMAKIDWLLNFQEQFEAIRPRYHQAVIDAYERLHAIQEGILKIYGHVAPGGSLPDRPGPTAPGGSSPDRQTENKCVDLLVAWTRSTATWLAALTRRSHNYVLPVSVKTLAGAAAWDAGVSERTWSFPLPATRFDHEYYIRLRGVAGWVQGGEDQKLWTLNVQLPDWTTGIYEGDETYNYNQGVVHCKVSNVTERKNRFSAEIVGSSSLFNCSPIGIWTLSIQDAFGRPGADVPNDIHLDLYLAVVAS